MGALQVLAEAPVVLATIATALPKIQADMPLVLKTLADIKQAVADGKNPAALVTDLENILTDSTSGFADLLALLPATPAPAPTASAA